MSNRKIRVGELIKREVSDILHTRFKGRAVMITITEVDVSPDNKNAKVMYSVIETKNFSRYQAQQFLDKNHPLIKRELCKRIVLKYMPSLSFTFDEKNLAAARVNELLDTLGIPEGEAIEESEPEVVVEAEKAKTRESRRDEEDDDDEDDDEGDYDDGFYYEDEDDDEDDDEDREARK